MQAVPKTNNLKIRIQPHSTFMRDCRKAIELCTSLHTFRCTEPNVVPAFLMALQNKTNLQSVRVNSNFTTEQAKLLTNLGNLNEVSLELASWNMVDALPRWTMGLQKTLTSLVLYVGDVQAFGLGDANTLVENGGAQRDGARIDAERASRAEGSTYRSVHSHGPCYDP